MSKENLGLQVNFKSRGGTLINLYASDIADLSVKLEEIESVAAQIGALEGVLNANSAASGISAPPSAQSGSEVPSRPAQGPPGGTQLSQGAAPSCAHGPRTFKSGISKAGKPYKLWACSSYDRNDQCQPEWVRD